MRWKITNKETTIGNQKIKTTNKQFLMTVGDIVGAGKSASAAVANAITNIKALIKGFQDDPTLVGQTATATLINNLLQPLYVVIKGTEVYQTMMTVADIVTPIIQMVARGTGAWCSPGNIADIGQIVLGLVQEILIGIVTQIITKLKNWIWNYEFVIRNINEESSEEIIKILLALQANIQDAVKKLLAGMTAKQIQEWLNNSSNSLSPEEIAATVAYRDNINKAKEGLNKMSNVILPDGTSTSLLNALNGAEVEQFGAAWNTEYVTDERGTVRILRGSLSNKGIDYSDDGGNTWLHSEKRNNCFCCFAKINIGTEEDPKYRYLAGSAPYIKKSDFVNVEEEAWEKSNDQYSKDYYYYDSGKVKRYTKAEKDKYSLSQAVWETRNGCFNATEYLSGNGVWYSDNDGITWIKSNFEPNEYVGNLFEFQPKKNGEEITPTRVVGCSYDYRGIWYTENGNDWERSQIVYIDEPEDSSYGRWISITDGSNDKIHINTKEFGAVATIESQVYVLQHMKPASEIEAKAKFTIAGAFEKIREEFGNLIDEILLYIHQHYYIDITDYYSSEFWSDLTQKIIEKEYTLQDAKDGKDLQFPKE